jgi:RNA polymerase sigma-70 factor (ECF subfamily)
MRVLRQMEALFRAGSSSGLGDGQLLERFVRGPDEAAEAAFAALVDRHGRMVLRVCRQVFGNNEDARVASQATFLVLTRRASSIGRRESVGCWLHGVALRVANKDRVAAARRRAHERRGAEMAACPLGVEESDPAETLELAAIIHEELGRLPEVFRAPLILCYLEGLTQEQAAARLRAPLGTIQSRLARGRARIKVRLVRGAWAARPRSPARPSSSGLPHRSRLPGPRRPSARRCASARATPWSPRRPASPRSASARSSSTGSRRASR